MREKKRNLIKSKKTELHFRRNRRASVGAGKMVGWFDQLEEFLL